MSGAVVAASRRLWRDRPPLVPLLVIVLFILTAAFAHVLAPHDPVAGELAMRMKPPFWMERAVDGYWLGTDRLGRDILSRLLYGARISLGIAIVGVIVTCLIGSTIGLLAGFVGGWLDALLMRLVDVSLSLPGILFAALLAVAFGPSPANVVLVVALNNWANFARVVRGETLSLVRQDFVAAARVAGCSRKTLMVRHLLPNLVSPIVVVATLLIGHVIIVEAALSFLGVGLPPPTPSWGVMILDGQGVIGLAWWIAVIPGLAILLTVICINMMGDWMRDLLDPKIRQL